MNVSRKQHRHALMGDIRYFVMLILQIIFFCETKWQKNLLNIVNNTQ